MPMLAVRYIQAPSRPRIPDLRAVPGSIVAGQSEQLPGGLDRSFAAGATASRHVCPRGGQNRRIAASKLPGTGCIRRGIPDGLPAPYRAYADQTTTLHVPDPQRMISDAGCQQPTIRHPVPPALPQVVRRTHSTAMPHSRPRQSCNRRRSAGRRPHQAAYLACYRLQYRRRLQMGCVGKRNRCTRHGR